MLIRFSANGANKLSILVNIYACSSKHLSRLELNRAFYEQICSGNHNHIQLSLVFHIPWGIQSHSKCKIFFPCLLMNWFDPYSLTGHNNHFCVLAVQTARHDVPAAELSNQIKPVLLLIAIRTSAVCAQPKPMILIGCWMVNVFISLLLTYVDICNIIWRMPCNKNLLSEFIIHYIALSNFLMLFL